MISLAGRDILHAWGKFVFTGIGLGLLIGVTLVMAGVYRGMVDDGKALLDNSGADLWVVQKDTLGPYAESSSLNDDVYRAILAMPGVAQAANVTYLTMQVRKGESDVRTMMVGIAPGALGATPGWPPYLVAGRQITRGHYEAVADIATGFKLGDRLAIRRNHYTVVGLTRRMVSSSGDPMVFIPLKDAQEAQFLKDNDAIWQSRRRTEANPAFNRPGVPGLLDAVIASQSTNPLCQYRTGHTETRPCAGRGCRIHPALEAFDGLHPGADGRHPRRQADRHLGQADRHVPGDSGHRQRSHRCLHHLFADDGQDPRDRSVEAHRHPQPNHRIR
jgi:putative ABC transport system permease protein